MNPRNESPKLKSPGHPLDPDNRNGSARTPTVAPRDDARSIQHAHAPGDGELVAGLARRRQRDEVLAAAERVGTGRHRFHGQRPARAHGGGVAGEG